MFMIDYKHLVSLDIAIDSKDNVFVSDIGDVYPEISFIGNYLVKNWELIQSDCISLE